MKVLSIDKLPAPYSFDVHGGDPDRSSESAERVSVSTIKHYLSDKLSMNKYDSDFGSEGMMLKAWLGLAFEDRLVKDIARTDPSHAPHPGEIVSPSGHVMGHPDGFYFDCEGDLGVDEFKHTYSSSRHYATAEALLKPDGGLAWDYLFQVKSYVAILRACGADCREARLWTLAVMGNWRDSRDPELHCSRLLFEEEELDNQMIILEAERENAWAWKRSTRSG